MAGSNCYNSITFSIAAVNNVDSVIDKYQTCVFSTTCDSSTDAISDCLNADRVCKRFVVFLLGCYSCVQLVIFWGFRCYRCKYFSSVNKIVLASLDEYFSATVSNG